MSFPSVGGPRSPHCLLPKSLLTDIILPVATVSPDARDNFVPIIDSILAKSDLTTISEKRIRKGLQDVVGYDLTPQKVCLPAFPLSPANRSLHTFSPPLSLRVPSPPGGSVHREAS